MVCERWCVTNGVSMMACERWCVWQHGVKDDVWKMVCVWQSGVTKWCDSSSSGRLCVLRRPHDSQPRASSGHTRTSSSRRLCVLRMPYDSQPRPCAQQLLQQALGTAPATRKPAAGQPATTRAAAPPEGPVYAGQAATTRAAALATRKPAAGQPATTRAAAPPEGCVYCACHTKASRGPAGNHARSSSSGRLTKASRGPAANHARSSCSVYCACHTKASRGPAGDHARSSASRRPCVLRLPHERQPPARRRPRAQQLLQKAVCTAPATWKPAAGQPATTRAAAPPEAPVYAGQAATTRAAALATRKPAARSSSSRRLCVVRLPHESQPRASRRPRAQQRLQKALCIAPATRTPAAEQAATTREAAPPAGPMYCACHTKHAAAPSDSQPRWDCCDKWCDK